MKQPKFKPSGRIVARTLAKRSTPSNPYFLAFFTAVLAGLFSVLGGYFVAKFQADSALAQKQIEYRVSAYGAFLKNIDHAGRPLASLLLSFGSLAGKVATDGKIQDFEDRMSAFVQKNDVQNSYWQLSADFNVLRLHGSDEVSEICSDILSALSMRSDEINWARYPEHVSASYMSWKSAENNGFYAVTPRVSERERMMFITVAMLYEVLINQLRIELRSS